MYRAAPPPRERLRCPFCDSDRVQALLWVELVSMNVIEDDFDTECFCTSCEASFAFSALRRQRE